jgi:hypothetical protein
LSQGTVVKLLQQHGVETRFQGLTESETDAARELYESGLSLAKVGEKPDHAPSSVRKALLRVGVVMRPRNSLSAEPPSFAISLIHRGIRWSRR